METRKGGQVNKKKRSEKKRIFPHTEEGGKKKAGKRKRCEMKNSSMCVKGQE